MATATVAEIDALARTTAVRRRVLTAVWPTGQAGAVRAALEGINDAQDTYYDILHGTIHPAAAYPVLEGDPEDLSKALAMAVQDAEDWAGELGRLVPERSNEEGEGNDRARAA